MLVRPHDVVARVGGDEFAISCEDLSGPADAEEIAVRIIEGLSQPVAIADELVSVSASIGITMSDDASEAERMVDEADAAMYRAKQAGRNRYALHDDTARSSDAAPALSVG